MKVETTLYDMYKKLTEKERKTIFPYLGFEHSMPKHRMEPFDLRPVLDDSGPESFLIALQCGHGDVASISHAIAADIAILAIPTAVCEHSPAAGHVIGAAQAAQWYALGKVKEDYLTHECCTARDIEDDFIDNYTDSHIWYSLETAASACFHQRPGKDEYEGASCSIEAYENLLRAVACNDVRYMEKARLIDICIKAAADSTGIDEASESILEPLMASIIEDIRPDIDQRVDFIIRTHLGWWSP